MPLSAAPLRSWSPTTEIECIGLRDVFADPPDETLVLALNHHLFSPAAPSGGCCMRPSTPEGSAWKHDSVYESRSADRPALLPSAPNTALIVRRAAIAERKGDYVLQTADEAGRARKSCAVPCGDIQSSWFKYKAPAATAVSPAQSNGRPTLAYMASNWGLMLRSATTIARTARSEVISSWLSSLPRPRPPRENRRSGASTKSTRKRAVGRELKRGLICPHPLALLDPSIPVISTRGSTFLRILLHS
jgi:hypothetical protein